MPSRPQVAVRKPLPDDQPGSVDTPSDGSLSVPPLDRPIEQGQATTSSGDRRSPRRRPRLIVEGNGPGNATIGRAPTGGPFGVIPEFPVQVSKVQAPPLRDETLARHRLLDWLSVKIHRRAVLLTAEAGYGKTTLLADFTRRTRLRVLWFRLDRGDRDWTGFIAHLVAAVRVHLPEFGPLTRSLLAETATTAPSLETVLETFLRELVALPPEPSALVFDDFHLVDDAADIRHVVRELLTRGPERLTFVFASRREPPIRLARLRALGEVAELGTDDLRFDAAETERLFRDTYEMRLEPSMLAELSRRTEGWAASLQLVRAALHDRDPGQVRSFISSLSGAEGHLYEYLAEEVIGELPDDLQQFLMRTSVLETIDLTLGPVAADVTVEEAKRLIDEGERHGLFGKGGRRARHVARAHPLVRDFLEERLFRAIGESAVQEIHHRIALAAEAYSWQVSARHFMTAGATAEAERVLAEALDIVLGTGAYAAADELVCLLPNGVLPGAPGLILQSRIAIQRGDRAGGLALAEAARSLDPTSTPALLSLLQARHISGDVPGALETSRLLRHVGASTLAKIGNAYESAISTSVTGSLETAEATLRHLAEEFREEVEPHFLGVTLLNLALIQLARGKEVEALATADEAVDRLASTSAGVELVSARLARAAPLALLARMNEARAEIQLAKLCAGPAQTRELAAEIGWIESLFGDGPSVRPYIEELTRGVAYTDDGGEQAIYALGLVRLADGDMRGAEACAAQLRFGLPTTTMAFEAQRLLLKGLLLALQGQASAVGVIDDGVDLARGQGAILWAEYGSAMATLASANDPSAAIVLLAQQRPVILSMLVELLANRLADFSPMAIESIAVEAERRPIRWRAAMRRALGTGETGARLQAARILERIGESSDIARLRDAARDMRIRGAPRPGYALARRLAESVLVEDLGRIRIIAGPRVAEGPTIRRKVLALLCLLLTRPGFVLTREEVLDSLWQDHDPGSAMNSLNQTVYFLRRVFEPTYSEDLSPSYVGQDGETIWLDAELVDCTSRQCLEIIRSMPREPTPEGAVKLATMYRGRFALDFAYEAWADTYREALHTGYLRVIERAIRMDIDSGHVDRGVFLAERAAEVEPESEEIQLALARLYRQSGAHAAAAEQYSRYTKAMSELGVDPQPL